MKRIIAISTFLQSVISAILLTVAYIIGIGVVSIIGKMFNIQFLKRDTKISTWTAFQHSADDRKMY